MHRRLPLRLPFRLRPHSPLALALALALSTMPARANPVGPTVVNGQATIHQAGSLLSITNYPNSIINWQSFTIGKGEITRFIQQSAASAVLNRVVGFGRPPDPSVILGALQSNGRVFLINPSGVLFGAGAQIDVAGLVASSLNLSNEDFLGGRLRFTEMPRAGGVVNHGAINTASGGQVYLVGPSVANSGIITSPKGEVILAAGNSVDLVNPGTPNLRVEITAPDNQARNLGSIVADAGRVGIYAGLINHSGTTRADSAVATEDGRIVLKATRNATVESGSVLSTNGPRGGQVTIQSGDTTVVGGTISATGSAGKGGSVQVLGNYVGVTDNASIDVSGERGGGTALVSGDFQGKNPAVQNAFRTYFGPNATIRADALGNGDGGTVVVWSDDLTGAYGAVSARGGAQSGNGGLVEVSSHGLLDFQARVDTRAPNGRTGMLLLDPVNVCIYNTTSSLCGSGGAGSFSGGGMASVFTSTGDTLSVLQWGTISSQLSSNNVFVTTSGPGTGLGNITVAEDSADLVTAHLLGFAALNDIILNGRIWNTSTGDLRLFSGWDEAATPVSALAANPFGPVATLQGVGNINVNTNVDMGGNTHLRAGNDINVGSGKTIAVVSSSGDRTLTLDAGNKVALDNGHVEVDTRASAAAGATVTVASGPGGILMSTGSGIIVRASLANGLAVAQLVSAGDINIFNNPGTFDIPGTVSGVTGIVTYGRSSLTTASSAGAINVQNSFMGAMGNIDSARTTLGANGQISIGTASTIAAQGSRETGHSTGATTQTTLIGNGILVNGGSEILSRAGGGLTVPTGGAASVNLVAAQGLQQVATASSATFDPISIVPVGPITIQGAKSIAAIGGEAREIGGDAALTIRAGGPVTIADTNLSTGLGVRASGGPGSPTVSFSDGGKASTLVASLSGITSTRSHVGAGGGWGRAAAGSAVTQMSALGGDLLVDGTGAASSTVSSRGGSIIMGPAFGGSAGAAETNLVSSGSIRIVNDLVEAIGGDASQGSGGAAKVNAVAAGSFSTLDSTVKAAAGLRGSGRLAGEASLNVVADRIRLEKTAAGAGTSTLISQGGSRPSGGIPLDSGSANLVVLDSAGTLELVNERIEVSGGQDALFPSLLGPALITVDFQNRAGGGFSVNGRDGAVTDSSAGFFANGQPAQPGVNFFVIYRGTLPPSPEPAPLPPSAGTELQGLSPAFERQTIYSLGTLVETLVPERQDNRTDTTMDTVTCE